MMNYGLAATVAAVALSVVTANNANAITITAPGALHRAVVDPIKQIWCPRPGCFWGWPPYYSGYYAPYGYGFFDRYGYAPPFYVWDGRRWHRHW
jgi:hypothetical protein